MGTYQIIKLWSVLIWIQVAHQWRRLLAVHLHLVQIIVPFRLVNYSNMAWQLSSYIPLASATFIYVGCGRAIYTLDLNKTAATPGGFGNRVEVLVCNYGPVDRTTPRQLYKLGQPGLCPLSEPSLVIGTNLFAVSISSILQKLGA